MTCKSATSAFVVTRDKVLCTVVHVNTFQDRMRVAIERAGGQSELARKIQERYGLKISPQRIQWLASPTVAKPAKGSRITPQIAGVAGLRAEWLASGKGLRDEPEPPKSRGSANGAHKQAAVVSIRVKETGEVVKMELTKQALEVAKAFMDLSKGARDKFHRAIEVERIKHLEEVPDEKLAHLSAKAKIEKAKQSGGTQ